MTSLLPPEISPHTLNEAGGVRHDCAYRRRLGTSDSTPWAPHGGSRSDRSRRNDGYHRDTRKVLEQNWPVFSRGGHGQDAAVRSSVVDFRCPIEIGGVAIQSGELIFGDLEGVVIVPKPIENEVIERALEKARRNKLPV